MATKLELERALQKLKYLEEKVSREVKQREELTTLVFQLEELKKVLKMRWPNKRWHLTQ